MISAVRNLIYGHPDLVVFLVDASDETYPNLRESGLILTPTPTPTVTIAPTPVTTPISTVAPTPVVVPTPTVAPTTVTPVLGDTWTRSVDGMMMVYVPDGQFEMGSDDDGVDYALQLCNEYYGDCEREWFEDEQSVHTIALDGFWVDQTEVTNGQYQQCVEAGVCDPPTKSQSYTRDLYYGNDTYIKYPVVYVSWYQAETYCQWVGARLPTEVEWEYTARGPEGLIFPWGNEFDGTKLSYCDVNCDRAWADETVDDGYADTAPTGSFPAGESWCGALDMAGNVWEWVADQHTYPSGRQVNPPGPSSGEYRVLRGGSWDDVPCNVRGPGRSGVSPGDTNDSFGFRCAKDSE